MVVLTVMVLAGCSSSREVRRPEPMRKPRPATDVAQTSEPATTPSERNRTKSERQLLIDEITKWIGTPYRYGGNDRSGIDCSAFVRSVYRDAFAVELPRTTEQQVQEGREVPASDLRMGDLVFFRPQGKDRHVGIFLDGGEFAHASTSQGVTISRLDEKYWM